MNRDGWEDGVYYRGLHIWVSGRHSFGEACVLDTGVNVRVVVRRECARERPEEIDRDYDFAPGTTRGVVQEWHDNLQRIYRAERRARAWSAGFWAARKATEAA